ncbi:MAG: methyltransferase, partial [Anaerolineae bacterium]|nr:methyltransferase [Anaerolineae bacterium]
MMEAVQRAAHADLVRRAVLTDPGFLRLTFSGDKPGEENPWVRVVVRPVEVQGRRRMLFSYWDGTQDTTSHYDAGQSGPQDELAQHLDQLLSLPFRHIDMQTSSEDLHVRITKKGKALVSRGKPSRPGASPRLAHDRDKERLLDPHQAQDLLRAIGISDAQGRIRPGMGAKYRQVEQFLRVLDANLHGGDVARDVASADPLQVVDCGCGSAYLTLAAYYYLNVLRDISARFYGVDLNAELIEQVRSVPARLDWERITFHVSSIA